MLLTATILSTFTLLAWGLSDFLAGKGSKDLTPSLANFVIQLVGYPLTLSLVIYYGYPELSLENILLFLFIAGLFTLAYISMIKGLAIGPVGVVAPLANSYAAVTLVFAILFLGFQLKLVPAIAFLVIIAGGMLLSFEKSRKKVTLKESAIVAGLLAAFLWGMGFGFLEPQADRMEWYHVLFFLHTFMVAIASFMLLGAHKNNTHNVFKEIIRHKLAVIAGILLTFGSITFFIAIQGLGSVVVPAVIASASPLATSFFAAVYDKERLRLYQHIGALMVIVGIIILNLNS